MLTFLFLSFLQAGEEPPVWLKEEEEGTGEEQESQGPPPAWKPAAGVQPQTKEEHLAGDAYLARKALSHGEKVGLLPWGQAHVQVLSALLQGNEQPLSAAGNPDRTGV